MDSLEKRIIDCSARVHCLEVIFEALRVNMRKIHEGRHLEKGE